MCIHVYANAYVHVGLLAVSGQCEFKSYSDSAVSVSKRCVISFERSASSTGEVKGIFCLLRLIEVFK